MRATRDAFPELLGLRRGLDLHRLDLDGLCTRGGLLGGGACKGIKQRLGVLLADLALLVGVKNLGNERVDAVLPGDELADLGPDGSHRIGLLGSGLGGGRSLRLCLLLLLRGLDLVALDLVAGVDLPLDDDDGGR